MTRTALTVVAAAAALVLALTAQASAATPTRWLCNPVSLSSDPCRTSLTASVPTASGATRVERTRAARRPEVDCFYVYPTVSGQPTPTASLAIDPEQRAIAQAHAARFTSVCRTFAPVYRQYTLRGIGDPALITPETRARAYGDVQDAWREYLRRYNRGRGVILIGHSQGTFMLRELVKREIDPRASARRRIVSAMLIGGDVTVRRGSDRGGDFRNVRACRRERQIGCVVAYSMFGEQPPDPSRFGRVDPAAGEDPERLEVLCTNPANLGGGTGRLRPYIPTADFPGTLGVVVNAFQDFLPQVATPWVVAPGRWTARCARGGGASWLQVDADRGGTRPAPSPDPGWGLHLGDVNLALGNLVDLARTQARAYVRARS
jgi:hypothetical protein